MELDELIQALENIRELRNKGRLSQEEVIAAVAEVLFEYLKDK